MTDPLDTQLPANDEAEQALLGSLLMDEDATHYDEVDAILRDGAAEFTRERNRWLYEVLWELRRAKTEPTGPALKVAFEARGQWDALGKFITLVDLKAGVLGPQRAAHYATLVHVAHLDRQLFLIGSRIIDRARDGQGSLTERLEAAESEILKLAEARVSGEPQSIAATLCDVFAELDRQERSGVASGLWAYDDLTGGLQPGELVLIGARPSHGKTALLLSIADKLTFAGHSVLFFSLEMSAFQLSQRLLAMRTGVPMRAIRHKDLTDAQRANLDSARDALEQQRLVIDDTSGAPIGHIRAKARLAKRCHTCDVVLLDYLQLARGGARFERRDLEVGAVAKGLKDFAKELNIPVVTAAQLNREVENRPQGDRKPRLADLRESGELEQHADVIGLIHWEPGSERLDNGIEVAVQRPSLIVAKQRNGPTGTIPLQWHKETMRFDNIGAPTRAVEPVRDEPAENLWP